MLSNRFIAIVLCAGFGTRLRPFTNYVPKTVAPIGNTPISFYSIKHFLDAGFEEVHCNTFYLADYVEAEIRAAALEHGYDPSRIRFWREEEILNTGGGIARIWHALFKETGLRRDAFVVSGDIFCPIESERQIRSWEVRAANVAAQMVTRELATPRPDSTWVKRGGDGARVVGYGKDFSHSDGLEARVFTNHQIISHTLIEPVGIELVSSIDLFYRAALRSGRQVENLDISDASKWFDIGNYPDYSRCIAALPSQLACAVPDQVLYFDQVSDHIRVREGHWPHQLPRRMNRIRVSPKQSNNKNFSDIVLELLRGVLTAEAGQGPTTPSDTDALVFALRVTGSPGHLPRLPILVPLELLEADSLVQGFAKGNPYNYSRTYFLFE